MFYEGWVLKKIRREKLLKAFWHIHSNTEEHRPEDYAKVGVPRVRAMDPVGTNRFQGSSNWWQRQVLVRV